MRVIYLVGLECFIVLFLWPSKAWMRVDDGPWAINNFSATLLSLTDGAEQELPPFWKKRKKEPIDSSRKKQNKQKNVYV